MPPTAPPGPPSHRTTWALLVIVTAQLMVVLDASVVTIALPDIQSALGMSDANLSWVLNGYALTFGGLLLLGGRAGDLLGRRRVFLGGLALFTLASFVGGLAQDSAALLAARAAQGVGAAFAAPTALALITTTFAEGPERTRALGLFSAMSAVGASVGLILGGVLTDVASWRWVMFINVPIGVALIALAPRFIPESRREPGRFDLAGTVTGTLGIGSLVFAFIRVSESAWGDAQALATFAVAFTLLASFVAIERRAAHPMLPLRLLTERTRGSAFVVMLLVAGSMFSMFFFLSQFLQDVLNMGPTAAGLAFLPLSLTIFTLSQALPRFLPRIGTTKPMLVGLSAIVVAIAWLTQLSPSTGYAGGLLGPMLLFGFGAGSMFLPLTMVILGSVAPRDSGAASGALQTMQQAGGALGIAVLVSVYTGAHDGVLAQPHPGASAIDEARRAMAEGMTSAFTVSVILALLALLVTATFLRRGGSALPAPRGPAATATGDREAVPDAA
ncbi:MAG: MFS transporter [Solirubrobacteraceae bacterium]